jgi:hypothetical protein
MMVTKLLGFCFSIFTNASYNDYFDSIHLFSLRMDPKYRLFIQFYVALTSFNLSINIFLGFL